MEAYILIGLSDCDEQIVLEKLIENKEVKEAHILFGEWDIIAKLQVGSSEEIGTFMMDKVRKLEEVKLTSTLIVAK